MHPPRTVSTMLVRAFTRIVPAPLGNTLTWRRMRHRIAQWVAPRRNSHFTGFLRLPSQFKALAGPVLAALLNGGAVTDALDIAVLGCSNGAEAYSVASVLGRGHPGLVFRVRGYDIDGEVLRKARTGRYAAEEIFNNAAITEEFVRSTFDRVEHGYIVKRRIRERVTFDQADALSPDLDTRLGRFDILFAQNFIFHLPRKQARKALENTHRLLHSGSALFIDGVDLDLRQGFARRTRLVPLDFEIEQIHSEARWARAVGWPYAYWGLEPLVKSGRDWRRRYATIFLNS
jgi:chemotaxis methyl-accepting protein methylase